MDAEYAVGGSKQRALRRSAGRRCRSVVTSADSDRDRTTQTDMMQCVHCGAHWVHEAGSGKLRGFCLSCNGFFCGPLCEACVPHEQLLANMEAGMPFHLARRHKPIKVSMGGVFLGELSVSTGFLQSAGVWVEAADNPPPRRVASQPGPCPDEAVAALYQPVALLPPTLGWMLPQQHLPPPRPPRKLPDWHFQARERPENEDVGVIGAWRDQGGTPPPRRPPSLAPPRDATVGNVNPLLIGVELLIAWQPAPDVWAARRPLPPRSGRADEAPVAVWAGLVGTPPDLAVAVQPVYADVCRPPRPPTRTPAAPPDGPPPVYAHEAVLSLFGWRAPESPPPHGPAPRRPLEQPAAAPAWLIDVAGWTPAVGLQQPPVWRPAAPPRAPQQLPQETILAPVLDAPGWVIVAAQQPPPLPGPRPRTPREDDPPAAVVFWAAPPAVYVTAAAWNPGQARPVPGPAPRVVQADQPAASVLFTAAPPAADALGAALHAMQPFRPPALPRPPRGESPGALPLDAQTTPPPWFPTDPQPLPPRLVSWQPRLVGGPEGGGNVLGGAWAVPAQLIIVAGPYVIAAAEVYVSAAVAGGVLIR